LVQKPKDKNQKANIYARLLNVEDPDKLDKKAFAESMGITTRSLSGYITTLKANPAKRKELKSLGFTEDQIPGWAAPDDQNHKQDQASTIPDAAKPAASPRHVRKASKGTYGVDGRSGVDVVDGVDGQNQPGLVGTGQQAGSAQATAYAAADKVLQPGGQHIESLGSDALENWIRENAVEKINDTYYQRRVLPSGETALVPTRPPAEVMEAERMGNAEISQMMMRNLEGETAALIKKVAFNPEAFTYFAWAKRKGYLDKDNDFADFANYCIQLTMSKIFGARIGVIINTDNTLVAQLKEKKQAMGIEYTT